MLYQTGPSIFTKRTLLGGYISFVSEDRVCVHPIAGPRLTVYSSKIGFTWGRTDALVFFGYSLSYSMQILAIYGRSPKNINAYQSIESVTHSLCLERSIQRISPQTSPARSGSFKHGRWTIQQEIPLWLVLGWGLWSAGMISTSLEVCQLSLKNPILYDII